MIKRGVYQTSFKGLTFSELWRMGGPIGFLPGVFFKLTGFKSGELHLPSSHFQRPIPEEEVEAHLIDKIADWVEQAKRIGYDRCSYLTYPKNETNVEGVAFIAINGECTLFIGYVKTRYTLNGKTHYKEGKVSTGALEWQDGTSTVFVNHNNYFDDPHTTHIIIKTKDIFDLHREMLNYKRSQRKVPIQFSSFSEFTKHMNSKNDKSEMRNIERGLYVFKHEVQLTPQ